MPNPETLREKAALCRRAAATPTLGGYLDDRLLLGIAEHLERQAAALEPPPSTPLFADVLMAGMMNKDLNSSGLARRVWGITKDSRGYDVARNRDRVGHYLRNTSYPKPANLRKIADVLGMAVTELADARRPPRARKRA